MCVCSSLLMKFLPLVCRQRERPSIWLIRSNYSNEPQVMIQWDWLIKWEAPIRHVWLCQSYRLQTKRDNRRQTHFNWGIKTSWNSLCPHAPTMPRQIGWWNDNKVIVMYTLWSQSAAAVWPGENHHHHHTRIRFRSHYWEYNGSKHSVYT